MRPPVVSRILSGLLVLLALLATLTLGRWWYANTPLPLVMLSLGLVALLALGLWRLDVAWRRQDQAEAKLRQINADLEARITTRTLELQDHLKRLTQTNAALLDSHETLRHVLGTTLDGFWQIDATGCLTDVNPRYCEQSGYSRDELLQMRINDLEAQEDAQETARRLAQLKEVGHDRFVTRHRRKDGSLWHVEVSTTCYQPEAGGIYAFLRDISQQVEQQQALEHVAHFDALTQLPNRALLTDRLSQKIAHGQRSHEMMAVCMLDLDGFKPVNDQFGHQAGDQLLREVAQRLRESTREEDLVGRLGGDEFVLALGGLASIDECRQTLQRVLTAVGAPYQVSGHLAQVTCSVGVSIFPGEGSDPAQLLRQADAAMYTAKKAGKNRFHLHDPSYELHSAARSGTSRRIGKALAGGQFELQYQPKIDCRMGTVQGVEALLRWHHPILGTLAPAEFVPLIEKEDLVIDVGEWVFAQALAQQAQWLAQHQLKLAVSINVAARQLLDRKFAERLRQLLARHPPELIGLICLDVTESVAMDNIAAMADVIGACHTLGVQVALDDFGTGFSSLAHLKRLPADELKIDRSFVASMLEGPQDLAVVQSIVALCAAFKRQVSAEGVEMLDQVLMLLELGCSVMQGYALARPMPADAVPDWVAQFVPDTLWQLSFSSRPSRDYFELLLAETNHRQWVERLLHDLCQTPDPAALHSLDDVRNCRFGRWLQATPRPPSQHGAHLARLDALHHSIHQQARHLCESRRADQIERAHAAEHLLNQQHEDLRALICQIRLHGEHQHTPPEASLT